MTPDPPSRKVGLITGAARGIGRCVAARLAAAGTDLWLVGRSPEGLADTRNALAGLPVWLHTVVCDLNRDDDLRRLGEEVKRRSPRLDFLVHCAGTIALAPLAETSIAAFDEQYRVNARAPLLLTQALLAPLTAAHGQIVFVNSSLGFRIKEGAGAYAASKHALKAVAETFRAELQATGIRVLNVFPGNTATDMQRHVCRSLNRPFVPEAMLQPDDVAAAIVNALSLPPTAALTELHILPARP